MNPNNRTFTPEILVPALWQAVVKLDPRWMAKNPVMFVVEIGAVLTLMLTIDPTIFGAAAASHAYNFVVTVILLLTVLFANYAEAVAEARGGTEARIYVRGDKKVDYGTMMKVMGRLSAAGFHRVALVTEFEQGSK